MVERFTLYDLEWARSAGRKPTPSIIGDLVRYSDYASLQKELAERTAELIIAPAECGDNCDDPDCPYSHTPLTLRQAYENAVSRMRAAESRADTLARRVEGLEAALSRIADPRNIHFAGDAQIVARNALAHSAALKQKDGGNG